MSKPSFVYISADADRNLSIQVTKDLDVSGAMEREAKGLATRIVYAEEFQTILDAHDRLKALRKMSKVRREKLIWVRNPEWKELASGEAIRPSTTWLTDPRVEDEGPGFEGGSGVPAPRRPNKPRSGADAKRWQV